MGKAANNEQRKSFANFLTTLAAAAAVAGLVIPTLALFWDKNLSRATYSELWAMENSGRVLLGMFTAFCIAIGLRGWAKAVLSKIED
jgi:hypothetical protein